MKTQQRTKRERSRSRSLDSSKQGWRIVKDPSKDFVVVELDKNAQIYLRGAFEVRVLS